MNVGYNFRYIDICNMCGSAAFTILGKRLNRSQGKNPKKKVGITTTIVRCDSCGLIFSNPQPVPHSLLDHYGIPPEAYWKEEYFQVSDKYFLHEITTAKSLIGNGIKPAALDVGAGIGKSMIALQRAGFEVSGLEPSEPFYKRAISRMNIDPEKIKCATIEAAVYPEASFDFVTFGAVLEHVFDPSGAIRKALGWLRPGGVIQAEVPSSRWLISKIANLYYRTIGTDYVANISPMHIPFHLYEFSVDSFRKHGKNHDYEVVLCEHYVCQTYMPKYLDYLLIKAMEITQSGMQICVWLRKNDKGEMNSCREL